MNKKQKRARALEIARDWEKMIQAIHPEIVFDRVMDPMDGVWFLQFVGSLEFASELRELTSDLSWEILEREKLHVGITLLPSCFSRRAA